MIILRHIARGKDCKIWNIFEMGFTGNKRLGARMVAFFNRCDKYVESIDSEVNRKSTIDYYSHTYKF